MDSFTSLHQTIPEACLSDPQAYVAESTCALNREAAGEHFRHLGSWLLRAGLVAALFLFAHIALQGELGGIVKVAGGLLAVHQLFYVFKGHKRIHARRKAGLYWLQDEAAQAQALNRDRAEKRASKPRLVIAGKIEQDEVREDLGWMRKQALS